MCAAAPPRSPSLRVLGSLRSLGLICPYYGSEVTGRIPAGLSRPCVRGGVGPAARAVVRAKKEPPVPGTKPAWLRPASRITRFYRDRASRGRDTMRGSGCLAFSCLALSRGPPASAGAAFSAVGLVRGGRQPGLDVAGGFSEPAAAFPRPLPREHRRARLGWPRWLRLVPRSRLVCPRVCPYRKGRAGDVQWGVWPRLGFARLPEELGDGSPPMKFCGPGGGGTPSPPCLAEVIPPSSALSRGPARRAEFFRGGGRSRWPAAPQRGPRPDREPPGRCRGRGGGASPLLGS